MSEQTKRVKRTQLMHFSKNKQGKQQNVEMDLKFL